jgi:hypothetical protein
MAKEAPTDSLPIFRWSPADDTSPARRRGVGRGATFGPASDAIGGAPEGNDGLLTEQLADLVEERAAGADDVARRIARAAHAWLDDIHSLATDGRLQRELADVWDAHGWRGPVAGLRAALAAAATAARAALAPEREALLEECALWCDDRTTEETDTTWDGKPLGAGVRLPDRARIAAPFLSGPAMLERGEVIVVHGWSETVARTLEAAQRAGLAPEAIVSEGGPDLGGRRLARRLVAAGIAVRFIYDAAVYDAVRRADRVWLGTDAIGARAFVARIGTRVLLQEARRAEVRTAVLATSDKLVPGGDLVLPRWCEAEPWLLWERPPMGVTIASQTYEAVPLELADVFATEFGLVGAAELAVRALRTS